jgi:hypothetical protein
MAGSQIDESCAKVCCMRPDPEHGQSPLRSTERVGFRALSHASPDDRASDR